MRDHLFIGTIKFVEHSQTKIVQAFGLNLLSHICLFESMSKCKYGGYIIISLYNDISNQAILSTWIDTDVTTINRNHASIMFIQRRVGQAKYDNWIMIGVRSHKKYMMDNAFTAGIDRKLLFTPK